MVLRLFLGLLLEFWMLSLDARVASPDAYRVRLDQSFRRQAIRIRTTAERMGGLIVKVGQFLSSRVDLLPQAFVSELADLQDRVQPSPWEDVRPIVEEALGPIESAFRSFDPTPIASASLGQVYRATGRDGQPLAVKVRRPHIAQIVRADLAALQVVVAITSRLTHFGRTFDLSALLQEFRATVTAELDYLAEAENADRVRRDTLQFPWLHIPRIHHDMTTAAVLTMDIAEGFKLTDFEAFQTHQVSRRETAERLIHLYLHMVMETGFFHADPHPGNFLVEPNGDIVFLDFGMVGSIATAVRRQIRLLFVGVSERRPSVIVDSLYALGIVRPEASRRDIHLRIAYLLERYYAETLQDMRSVDIDHLLHDVEHLVREEPIQFPAHFAFLGRAISMLVGLTTTLDPEVNVVELFTPYARRFVLGDGGPAGYVSGRVRDWTSSVVAAPPVLLRVLRQMEDGELETSVRWNEGAGQLKGVRRSLRSLATAVWVLGLAGFGIWLRALTWTETSDVAFALAALVLLVHWRRPR
jgi:predicted unusual protein kinase regulating ubiquinone biosynthesis (AarF/ABC1/UbiB family)